MMFDHHAQFYKVFGNSDLGFWSASLTFPIITFPLLLGRSVNLHCYSMLQSVFGAYNKYCKVLKCIDPVCSIHVCTVFQVAITGFSFGGCISLAAAVKHPDLFAATIPCYGIPPNQETYPPHKIRIPVQAHYCKNDMWAHAVPEVSNIVSFS